MARNLIRDLGDGLILRRATLADTEMLVAFHGDVHRDPGMEEPDERVAAWTRDLMTGDHPRVSASHFTLVEDTRRRAVVSSACLIPQTWSYEGVEFGVGRPELVGTHPDYRRRGLVRAQFEVLHAWSAEQGHLLQSITGIPWYYRQFGYEMVLSLGGGRCGYKTQVPALKKGEKEPYQVRPAIADDLTFIDRLYRRGAERSLVTCVRDEALWRYEMEGRSEQSVDRRELRVIQTADGGPVGMLIHKPSLWRGRSVATGYELEPGVSWLAVTPSVVRYLWAMGAQYAAQDKKQELNSFAFRLGMEHPVYQVLHDGLPHLLRPYAWYIRVADLTGFLRTIAPVLERRLAGSLVVGHSGELKISFYRDGLRLVFDGGRLAVVETWQPTPDDSGKAAFPDLTFLQLVFGYRSLEELAYAFADCWVADDEARALLNALFPKKSSDVWAVM
jgi:hypothetical protein